MRYIAHLRAALFLLCFLGISFLPIPPLAHARRPAFDVPPRVVTFHIASNGQPIIGARCSIDSFGWGVPRGQGQATIVTGQTDTQGTVTFDVSTWPPATYQVSFSQAGLLGHPIELDMGDTANTFAFDYTQTTNTLSLTAIHGTPVAAVGKDGGTINRQTVPLSAQLTAYAPTYASEVANPRRILPTLPAVPAATPVAPLAALDSSTNTAAPEPSVIPSTTTPSSARTAIPLFLSVAMVLCLAVLTTTRGRRVARSGVTGLCRAFAGRRNTRRAPTRADHADTDFPELDED